MYIRHGMCLTAGREGALDCFPPLYWGIIQPSHFSIIITAINLLPIHHVIPLLLLQDLICCVLRSASERKVYFTPPLIALRTVYDKSVIILVIILVITLVASSITNISPGAVLMFHSIERRRRILLEPKLPHRGQGQGAAAALLVLALITRWRA